MFSRVWGQWWRSLKRTSSLLCLLRLYLLITHPLEIWWPNTYRYTCILWNVCPLDRLWIQYKIHQILLVKKELILVFLFSKYNIAPLSTTTKIYSRDVVLLSRILRRRPMFEYHALRSNPVYTSRKRLHKTSKDIEVSISPVVRHRIGLSWHPRTLLPNVWSPYMTL